ncbi:hypothetical protein FQN54_000426 [Arachnomyces sp. PD_36]|nr:hypothetical protein FQN54_000426 [Arachnomyces sp. PD_36]
MGGFFEKLRGNAGANNSSTSTSAGKKDNAVQPPTPLERMLLDSGPLRDDGSDKFFGMENFGNTCYCNSILQCLYYSVPFRESVINFPRRSSAEALSAALATNLKYQNQDTSPTTEADALAKQQKNMSTMSTKAAAAATSPQPNKPEDKDSPEYKKKVAMNTLPILETQDNAASYGMPESLFTSLKDIFEAVVASQARMGVIRPNQFLEVLRREHEMFRTAMHQDAHEFLNLLLNKVVTNVETESQRIEAENQQHNSENESSGQSNITSNGTKSPNTTRWVHELFEGTLTSETQCLTCEKVSQRDEAFLDLSVDLDQHSSVTSCLRKFSEEEMLCERNKFHCDTCGGLQEAEKRMKIKRLPRILALHLKRFKYTEDLQRLQKLFHRVVYPYHLRLFNTTDDAEDPDRLYELYAVVVHIGGGPYHGHYVAIIKTEDRGWLLFDDEMVEPVDKNYVRNFFGDRPGLACAYVLFYQETTLEAVQREQEREGATPMRSSSDIKDMVSLSSKINGTPITPDLGRVHSAHPGTVPEHSSSPPSTLDQVSTAPQLSTRPEKASPALPPRPADPVPPIPANPMKVLNSKKSDIFSRKEKSKEEKERKIAEKDKERAEKQKRKEIEAKYKETQRKQDADLKAAIEASRATKVEEDRRNTFSEGQVKENGTHVTLTGSIGRFKRGSRSISQRLSSREERKPVEKSPPLPENHEPEVPKLQLPQETTDSPRTTQEVYRKDLPPAPQDEAPALPDRPKQGQNNSHHRWNRFNLKKKSFSILSPHSSSPQSPGVTTPGR